MFFQLLLKITVNLMAKIMQNAYLCDISLVEHKKIPFHEDPQDLEIGEVGHLK